MSAQRTTEGISIAAVPLAVFALFLLVPFLNFEFTVYRSTLKLFVFATATALLWCYVLWSWGCGLVRGWPAYWVFVPVVLWVAWGLATMAWSPHGWLGRGGVVQGLVGAAGALGLAVLLREEEHRRVFVAAGSAVAFALAFFMVLYYGDPRARFLGDVDHLGGREAGAAFLLLPTLVGVAALYQRAKGESEGGHRGVVWMVVLLVVLLLAGLRTGSAAWRYGLGAGLVVVVWLMLPRWRLAAAALAVLIVVAAAHREVGRAVASLDYRGAPRSAVLDRADWCLVRGCGMRSAERGLGESGPQSAARGPQSSIVPLVFGNGVGTWFLAYDLCRPVWTYAVSRGDEVIGHARRQLAEVLFERGLVGVGIALAVGAACVVAGALAYRRAREGLDSALGAGLAAAVVGLGVFACFSNGAVGFGSGMMFWVGLGLLGALSATCGRPAGLSWSPEEEAARAEAEPLASRLRAVCAALGGATAVAAWLVLAAGPFWAEYCLREGQAEDDACQRLHVQMSLAERSLRQAQELAKKAPAHFDAQVRAAEDALRAATVAHEKALQAKEDEAQLKALAAKVKEASAALDKARPAALKRKADIEDGARHAQEVLQTTSAAFAESARRTDSYLRRAAALSLGDRVWLGAQVQRARSEAGRGEPAAAVGRLQRLKALVGPASDLEVQLAGCYARLGQPAEAHALYRRYARKNPFGARSALFSPRVTFYEDWHQLIRDERNRKNPQAAAWAADFAAAATEGLRWHPEHYALLLLRGDMLNRFGDKERARADMMAAAGIIKDELGRHETPVVRARLLLELANAYAQWDKDEALRAARHVLLQRLNLDDPEHSILREQTFRVIRLLEPPKEKGSKPPESKARQEPAKGTQPATQEGSDKRG